MTTAPAIMIAASVFSAYTQYQGGQNAQESAKQTQRALNQTALDNLMIARENRVIADAEANALLGKGTAAVGLKRKEVGRLEAYQRVTMAKSGFRDSPTDEWVRAATHEEGEQDVATIWSNALVEAESMRAKGRVASLQGQRMASQQVAQGDIVAQQGKNAAGTGFYEAGATLLRGVSQAYGASKGYFTPYTYARS